MATLLHIKCLMMEKNPRAVSDAVASNWKYVCHCKKKKACLQTGLWVLLYWLHKAGKSKLFFSPVYCRD